MRYSRVLAVDCGASHVAVGAFRRGRDGRLTLERGATEPVTSGRTGDREWAAAVGIALGAAGRRAHLGGACVVGLPAHLTVTKVAMVPAMKSAAPRSIIRFEIERWLPGAAAELHWSQVPAARAGAAPAVVITAAKRVALEALIDAINAAGFRPRWAVPAWMVLRGGGRPSADGGRTVLAVGARSSLLVHADGAGLLIRTLSMGGDAVTEAIAGELGLDRPAAEALKLRVWDGGAGAAPTGTPQEMAVQLAADGFIRRLGAEVARSLEVVVPADRSTPPLPLLLAGGGALPGAMARELARLLQRPVARWDAGGGGAATLASSRDHDLATLAACAGGREAVAVNLIPRPLRRRWWWRRWRPALAAAAVLVAAGLPGLAWHCRKVAAETRGRTATLEQRIEAARRLTARHHACQTQLGETNRRVAALRRIVTGRSAWVLFLADLQDRVGAVGDVWLDGMQRAPPAGRGAADRPRIQLAGCILDPDHPLGRAGESCDRRAKALVAALGRAPWVVAVEGERFEAGRPGVLQFELTLVLDPQGPLGSAP